jgi:hypothetical protein
MLRESPANFNAFKLPNIRNIRQLKSVETSGFGTHKNPILKGCLCINLQKTNKEL